MDEFALINKLVSPIHNKEGVILGRGDDCSIVDFSQNEYLVQTTDCLVQDIHFRTQTMTASEIAKKTLLVNMSDISAMGARPHWCHLSLAVPKNIQESWVEDFFQALNDSLQDNNIQLLGGDLSQSPRDIFINVHLSGKVKKDHVKKREGLGKPSVLLVTGPLGDSSAGLFCLENQVEGFPLLVGAHKSPPNESQKAIWLSKQSEVLGLMDLSDGLLSDLERIPTGFLNVDLNKIPHSTDLEKFCNLKNFDPMRFSIAGGEDYVLLLSCKKEKVSRLCSHFQKEFGEELYAIGEVLEGDKKVLFFKDGKECVPTYKKFSHF